MLTHIHIKNFTIVDSLSLDFDNGLTVLTGETGAGKSIIVDALSLALGGRADHHCLRKGTDSCDITVCFDISNLPEAQTWLDKNELGDDIECIIRRLIYTDGRSKSTINGHPASQNLVRELGQLLLQIHGQHQHQALLKRNYQQEILDTFSKNQSHLEKTENYYRQWKNIHDELNRLREKNNNREQAFDLLRYQFEELQSLDLQENEWETLSHQHSQLHNSKTLIENLNRALQLLIENEEASATALLNQAVQSLHAIKIRDPALEAINELLKTATIHLDEATSEIDRYRNQLDLSEERLEMIEKRLSAIHELARKHHVNPADLHEIKKSLEEKFRSFENMDIKIEELLRFEKQLIQQYNEVAETLSKNRIKASKSLQKTITESMQELGMTGGEFRIEFEKNEELITPIGKEKVIFIVKTNPGQDFLPLQKVVSGGELSRISLALQVIAAEEIGSPTLIFDEVDTGIGGKIADIVGKLLRTLGKKSQVLCITHLSQVAACGHHHFKVEKITTKDHVQTTIQKLNQTERIEEIARMISGKKITQETLAHAELMLSE